MVAAVFGNIARSGRVLPHDALSRLVRLLFSPAPRLLASLRSPLILLTLPLPMSHT